MNCSPSPNFNARAANISVEYIVLHYTGMRDTLSALAQLCDPKSEVSAHYLIAEDGLITHMVDEKYRAWHAGKSFWRGMADMNSASVGIELVNPGHEFGYRAFPELQMAALEKLLPTIIQRHGMNERTALLAHSDIAPARKEDPGELFPWQRLARSGLGLWPETQSSDSATLSDSGAAKLLSEIGYDVTNLDKTILAFQRRYNPNILTGKLDPETAVKLRTLHELVMAEHKTDGAQTRHDVS